MKGFVRTIVAFSMAGVVVAQEPAPVAAEPAAAESAEVVPAAEDKPEVSGFSAKAAVDVYSAYAWRGMILSDDPVWQPGADVAYDTGDFGELGLGVWASLGIPDNRQQNNLGLAEVDYTGTWSKSFGPVACSLGYRLYAFEEAHDFDMQELFATVAYENDIVTPTLAYYYDLDESDGSYVTLGLDRSFQVTDRVEVGAGLGLGMGSSAYNRYYFESDHTTVTDFNARLFGKYFLTDNVYIGATLGWSSLLDTTIRESQAVDEVYNRCEDLLWGGLNLGASL